MATGFGPSKPGATSIFANLGAASSGAQTPSQTTNIFAHLANPSQSAPTSSILGTAQPSLPPTSSLFQNLGQQTKPESKGGSLFDRITAGSTGQQPGLGLGGGTSGAAAAMSSAPQQPGSIFGGSASTTSQPLQAQSLFGGPIGLQSAQSQNILGGITNSQPAPAPSIFGGTTNSEPAPGPSIFGGSKSDTKPGLGLWGAGQSQPSQPGQLASLSQRVPDNQVLGAQNGSQSAYFNSLLEKNKKRTRDEGSSGLGEVPSLQLGLEDIAKRARQLGGLGGQIPGGRGADSKAHYLLAASGVNPNAALRDLNSLRANASSANYKTASPDWDPDSHKYVEQLQQQSTLKMIAEGIERAHQNFDAYLEENVDINWDAQRRRTYEHFGLTPRRAEGESEEPSLGSSGAKGSFGRPSRRGHAGTHDKSGLNNANRSIFGRSSIQKSVIGTPGVGLGNASLFGDNAQTNGQAPTSQDNRFLRDKQGRFADKIQEMNEARLSELVYPVLQAFASVESQPGADSPSQLLDAYQALIEIVQEDSNATRPSDPGAIKERQYADDYLDELPNSDKAVKIRKRILSGSLRALEKHFTDQVETLIARNPREASLGGIPTVVNKIRAYIRVRNIRKDLAPDGMVLQTIEDDYCWALVFFLLRCGQANEAAKYVAEKNQAFQSFDRNFVTYLTKYATNPDRRLPRNLQDKLQQDYQSRTRIAPENSIDPYQIACYKVIGRCELSKRSIDSIGQGVEDWIWLQFNLAREVNRAEEPANELFGLEEVRETIREIGQRHFSPGSENSGGFGTYFFLLILAGLFEQAVAYLYSHSYVSAVHFAIALDFYGLLRVSHYSASESELLTKTTRELQQINFSRMIGYYTRDFRASNAVAAVDYLALICLDADLPGSLGKSQAAICHEALRELVLETREFAQLLGDIRSDGSRIKGAIEQRLKLIRLADQEEFLRTVTLQAASVADDNGRTTDAVLLYHLAEDYDNAIVVINRALSDSVAVELGQEQLRLQPLKPRAPVPQQQPDGSSLSLTTVDDPAILAINMISLYNANALYYQKIRPINRDTCGVLLRLSEAKAKVEARQWAEAIDIISSLSLLPLSAQSSIPTIRSHANTLATLPPTILRLVGPLVLWTLHCISMQRDLLLGAADGPAGFDSDTRKAIRDGLAVQSKDIMTFSGLVKLRFSKGVWDRIVGLAGEIGAY